MAEASTSVFDTQDADVQSLYRLGQVTEQPQDDAENTDGDEFMYDALSEENAALLRRMLSTGPPMLASNTTLEVVDIREVCPVDKDDVLSLLLEERYANVFKRLQIVWPEELLPELTTLIRRQACCPWLSVTVTSAVDEGVLEDFFDTVAADKALRGLSLLGFPKFVRRTSELHRFLSEEYDDAPHNGMRVNYTVIALRISFRPVDSEGTYEMEAIIDRNARLLKQAAEFVVSGADVNDDSGVDALKKLRSSADLVEKVQKLTGKTEEAATEAIQSALGSHIGLITALEKHAVYLGTSTILSYLRLHLFRSLLWHWRVLCHLYVGQCCSSLICEKYLVTTLVAVYVAKTVLH
ncbi:hypothetical protein MTO96_023004 [Rhipicephalus appendiculatus]